MRKYVEVLLQYGVERGLLDPRDVVFTRNQILDLMGLDGYDAKEVKTAEEPLEAVLAVLLDDAAARGVLEEDTVTYRDLFDTRLMGLLTPKPSFVIDRFRALYQRAPEEATDFFYRFSQDTDYIRRYRVEKDLKWQTKTKYGTLEITINLSKPEKDPKAIAAAKTAPPAVYPKCALCRENEGFAGSIRTAARENHRVIPLTLHGEEWSFQYSPYVYYNEHCILLNNRHQPMQIDEQTFEKLLDFLELFPHYMVGSNADLPIVGGSILSHEHYQGGRFTFPMEKALVACRYHFPDFPEVDAGIVAWPLAVLRLQSADRLALTRLAGKVLSAWRGYTDQEAFILAETDGEPHNTITPIARMRDGRYELDLVLRNNMTTPLHPLGVYHPHEELHHIKKENIGLIEVMGLAVLPARLKEEMELLTQQMLAGEDLLKQEKTAKHAAWAQDILARYPEFSAQNAMEILFEEIGQVFCKVLEHAGVYKMTQEGQTAFLRFLDQI